MKKSWFVLPGVLALLVVGAVFIRAVSSSGPPAAPRHVLPQSPRVEKPAPAAAVAPALRPAESGKEGQLLQRAACEQRLTLCLEAGLSGRRESFQALKNSLIAAPRPAREVIDARLARATLGRERELLQDLLRSMP